VASEASEAFAVAGSTGGLVEIELAGSVTIEKVGGVIGGLEVKAGGVAFLATEGGFDFVVADKAIFHVGEVGFGERACGFAETAMAGLARVVGNEVGTKLEQIDAVGRAEVGFAVDGVGNQGRDVAEAEVALVVEILEDFSAALVTE